MAFLFKSKKNPPPGSLPPATRNIHTSEGTSPVSGLANGLREGGAVQSPTSSGSVNNSINSVPGTNSPDPTRMRQRAESESQVSYSEISKAYIRRLLWLIGFRRLGSERSTRQWCSTPEFRCLAISMVSTAFDVPISPSESIPSIWSCGELSRFQRR